MSGASEPDAAVLIAADLGDSDAGNRYGDGGDARVVADPGAAIGNTDADSGPTPAQALTTEIPTSPPATGPAQGVLVLKEMKDAVVPFILYEDAERRLYVTGGSMIMRDDLNRPQRPEWFRARARFQVAVSGRTPRSLRHTLTATCETASKVFLRGRRIMAVETQPPVRSAN